MHKMKMKLMAAYIAAMFSGTTAAADYVAGGGTSAGGDYGVIIGQGASTTWVSGAPSSDVVIGYQATTSASGAVVIGANASVSNVGAGSVAIGQNATVTAQSSIALGWTTVGGSSYNIGINGVVGNVDPNVMWATAINGGVANHNYSTAIGPNAATTRAYELQLGGSYIGGVLDGVSASDAVNKGQLDTVDAKATQAQSDAAAALTTANAAQTTATAAQTTADTARSEAAAAQSTANAAQTTANAAQTTATAAQTTADTARSEAAAAQSTANAAQTTANAAQTTADTALSNLQAAVNQLLESGICSVSGGTVTCGSNLALGSGQTIDSNATNAVVLGSGAKIVNPSGATGAKASGAIAIGAGAVANADPSVAIGNAADASGADAVAIGDSAAATGTRSVAIGFQATATHDGSVAIGHGSVTSAPNTVSVGGGTVGNRRITNVADPLNPDDAATKGYVDAAVSGVGGGIASQAVSAANAYTDRKHGEALRYAARGVAAAMATAPAVSLTKGETALSVASGYYDGEQAIGVSVAHSTPKSGILLSGGIAYASGGKPALRAGVSWKW